MAKMKSDKTRCKFCSSSMFGGGCLHSPYHNHVHEHGPTGDSYQTCVFCGMSSANRSGMAYGGGCSYSPLEGHVHKHYSDGEHCIYCGMRIRNSQDFGACIYSPTGKHCL